MSFNFGFANDDIGDSANEVEITPSDRRTPNQPFVHATEPTCHKLEELLKALPSKIVYSTIQIPGDDGIPINIPRRELFDIKAQLMAEDQMSDQTAIAGFPMDDIIPNLYEGGFKTWECSIDLAKYLLKVVRQPKDPHESVRRFIEVGAGTGLPTLVLFYYFLKHPPQEWSITQFCFADYNLSVIETTTVPNLLLTWHFARSEEIPLSEGELEITDNLLSRFLDDLSSMAIRLTAISGAWSDAFCGLVKRFGDPSGDPSGQQSTVFLASETIYSPHSIISFTEVLARTLRGNNSRRGRATALVAAKRVYFGVGGGIDEFLRVLGEYRGRASPVWESDGPGVGRVIMEISMDA